jgi:hypothetical protein
VAEIFPAIRRIAFVQPFPKPLKKQVQFRLDSMSFAHFAPSPAKTMTRILRAGWLIFPSDPTDSSCYKELPP